MIVSTSSVSPRRINSPHDGADQAAIEDLEEIESPGEIKFCQSSCGFRHPTVQIAPVEFIKRLGTGHSSWFVESIDVPIGRRVEFQFQGPVQRSKSARLLALPTLSMFGKCACRWSCSTGRNSQSSLKTALRRHPQIGAPC